LSGQKDKWGELRGFKPQASCGVVTEIRLQYSQYGCLLLTYVTAHSWCNQWNDSAGVVNYLHRWNYNSTKHRYTHIHYKKTLNSRVVPSKHNILHGYATTDYRLKDQVQTRSEPTANDVQYLRHLLLKSEDDDDDDDDATAVNWHRRSPQHTP